MKHYGPLARWLLTVGPESVTAVENLERWRKDITPTTFRELRVLLTPESRKSIFPALLRKGVTLQHLKAAIRDARFEMWVQFHWTAENEFIDKNKRMRFNFLRICA